jgi:folate-dependent tRNA-U54 methylase TrmFO/GidA
VGLIAETDGLRVKLAEMREDEQDRCSCADGIGDLVCGSGG